MSTPVQIDFTGDTQASILADMITYFETLSGRTLQPAQVEMLLINSMAYWSELNNQRINSAANQNLAQFAIGAALDLLVASAGVTRIPALAAGCTVLITAVAGHGNITVPAGTRIQSQDGLATFVIQSDVLMSAGTDTASVTVVCDTPGSFANGYGLGVVSIILDPKSYIATISNTNATAGGSEVESDANLRTRFFLAPNAYSTAGSTGSYKFWAKSASPLILDVAVNNGGGGVVNIYPLVAGGTTPTQILNAVLGVCNQDTIRPLTDTVNVISPTVSNYNIDISLIKYSSADSTAVLAAANANCAALAVACYALGIDIIVSQIIAAASVPGVAKVIVNAPSADITLPNTAVGNCTGITIAITGVNADK